MQIAVIGGSNPSKQGKRWAFEVGYEIAKRQAILVCGGLGGIMEEACRGAKSAAGITVGILPGNRFKEANPYIDIPIVTGMGYARNVLVVKSSQAVIAIEGSYGTLSEIAYALNFGLPVIGLETWRIQRQDHEQPPIYYTQNAIEAVEKAIAEASSV